MKNSKIFLYKPMIELPDLTDEVNSTIQIYIYR